MGWHANAIGWRVVTFSNDAGDTAVNALGQRTNYFLRNIIEKAIIVKINANISHK